MLSPKLFVLFLLAILIFSAPALAHETSAENLKQFVDSYNSLYTKASTVFKPLVGTETIKVSYKLADGDTIIFGVKTYDGIITKSSPTPYADSTLAISVSEETLNRIANSADPLAEFKNAWGGEIKVEGLTFTNIIKVFILNLVKLFTSLFSPAAQQPNFGMQGPVRIIGEPGYPYYGPAYGGIHSKQHFAASEDIGKCGTAWNYTVIEGMSVIVKQTDGSFCKEYPINLCKKVYDPRPPRADIFYGQPYYYIKENLPIGEYIYGLNLPDGWGYSNDPTFDPNKVYASRFPVKTRVGKYSYTGPDPNVLPFYISKGAPTPARISCDGILPTTSSTQPPATTTTLAPTTSFATTSSSTTTTTLACPGTDSLVIKVTNPNYIYMDSVKSVDWSPDSTKVVAGLSDYSGGNNLRIYDAVTGNSLVNLSGHTSNVNSVDWAPNNSIVSGSDDKTIKVWDPSTGTLIKTMTMQNTRVRDVAWGPEMPPPSKVTGRIASAQAFDSYINLFNSSSVWNVHIGQEIVNLQHNYRPRSLSWSPDGLKLAIGDARALYGPYPKDSPGGIYIWDPWNNIILKNLTGFDNPVNDLAWSPDGTKLVANFSNLAVFDTSTWTELVRTNYNGYVTGPVAWSPDSKRIASALGKKIYSYANRTILTISDANLNILKNLTGHSQEITSVSWSPDGKKIASASRDGTVRIWPVDDCLPPSTTTSSSTTSSSTTTQSGLPDLTTSAADMPDRVYTYRFQLQGGGLPYIYRNYFLSWLAIKNIGGSDSGKFNVSFWAKNTSHTFYFKSIDTKKPLNDPRLFRGEIRFNISGTQLAQSVIYPNQKAVFTINNVPAGGMVNVSVNASLFYPEPYSDLNIISMDFKNYSLNYSIDSAREVVESNENNNEISKEVSFLVRY